MFIEGPKFVSAFDVYTGRMLWKWKPPADDAEQWATIEIGKYDKIARPKMHRPMAGRCTSSEDVLYVISDKTLYALDAATGKALPSSA